MQDGIKQLGDAEKFQIEKYGGFYIGRYESGVAVLDKQTGTFVDSVTFGGKNLTESVVSSNDIYAWGHHNLDYFARSSSMTTLLGSTYGTNKANGNIVVKADAIPYYHADYYTAKEMSNRLYKNKSIVTSGLVTGTQWDMMMKYMQDNGVAIEGTNCNWGNYDDTAIGEITGYYTNVDANGNTDGFKDGGKFTTDSTASTQVLLTTGASEKVKKMNLYDVAGNLWEWTDEAGYLYSGSKTQGTATEEYNSFVIRGGAFSYTKSSVSACWRACDYVLDSNVNCGFRVVLYIK